MGVSVENQRWTSRIDTLRDIPTAVRFLSCEPLLGPLDLNLDRVSWVIVGGESGHRARPMKLEWATGVRDQCVLRFISEQHRVGFGQALMEGVGCRSVLDGLGPAPPAKYLVEPSGIGGSGRAPPLSVGEVVGMSMMAPAGDPVLIGGPFECALGSEHLAVVLADALVQAYGV